MSGATEVEIEASAGYSRSHVAADVGKKALKEIAQLSKYLKE
ncbi:hypothetical protein ACFOY4_01605 [Actinomadura syzygii]|nr:hypothetical protein [Actinomadura syzygii]